MSRSCLTECVTMPVPSWVPETAVRYLAHTETGQPIRALARQAGCHASTVLRQIRKLESRREDQLVDEALCRLGRQLFPDAIPVSRNSQSEPARMTKSTPFPSHSESGDIDRETCRILRRLTEAGAVLAVAQDMEKAVVVKDSKSGTTLRTAVVDREVAQALALKEWITCKTQGRIARYVITAEGRAALSEMTAHNEATVSHGFAEAPVGFDMSSTRFEAAENRGRTRYSAPESPLTLLARRREKNGEPFLTPDLVAAGERLREDFELAQIGPNVTQNWERFLTGRDGGYASGSGNYGAARDRLASALRDLGPGLGDVALRCCCYLEGLETAEKRMGWSARSGKIVLRIALQRLKRHYEGMGRAGQLIG